MFRHLPSMKMTNHNRNDDMLTDLAIALDISVMKLLSGFGDPIREKYRQGLLNISLEKMNALQERHLL